jgi:hypothetical protein
MSIFTEEETDSGQSRSSQIPSPFSSSSQAKDQRKYIARIPLEFPLQITAVGRSGPGRSLNISVTGLLLETHLSLELGDRVILTVTPPWGEKRFQLCAEVTRVASEAGAFQTGHYGVRVLSDDGAIWQSFLRLMMAR